MSDQPTSTKPYKIAKPIPQGRSKFSITESELPGILGGNRDNRTYGEMDCKSALSWISKGHYVKQRVFFHSEEDAIACGFRPCGTCMKDKFKIWNEGGTPQTKGYPWKIVPPNR